MAPKLKLAFQSLYQKYKSQLSLYLKTLVVGFLLWSVSWRDFQTIPILFFAVIAAIFYIRPFFDGYYTWGAFLIFLIVSILGLKIVFGSILFWPVLFLFLAVFYLLLGIKDYFFVKRARLYFVSILILFYSVFIIFFLAGKSEFFFLKFGLVILASFILFKEWLAIIPSFHFPQREFIAASVAAFLVAQLLWVVALLPIGFISSANLMLLFIFSLADFLLKHFTGAISRKFIFQHSVFFLALSALIFWTSEWTLNI
ncbi:MAG: hypothetical protein HZB99_03100 [Candidatus Harrisonbacteria bacterium]|nr:hypothetical protein [Candidatus Harrisonbacteria bacterium]